MNYGIDTSIFANGLPDGTEATSRPAMDRSLQTTSDGRLVLIMDLYKMQVTPPNMLWWSTLPDGPNQAPQPNPITLSILDLMGDTVEDARLAAIATDIETLILSDARFAAAQVTATFSGGALSIYELVQPTGGGTPIELQINATGSQVQLVRAT